jgi:DNA-binding CsgD family transcriptional regulator
MDDRADADAELAAARGAYRRRDWPAAHDHLEKLRRQRDLAADDLALLGDSAWWLGRIDESIAAGQSAYHGFVADGRPRQAAWTAIGVAVNLFLRGEAEPGAGWIQRAARLLADQPECAEHGYLRYLTDVEGALDGPDPDGVIAAAREVADLGRRLGVPDLVAAGTLGEGRVLVRQGQVAEGTALLDEAMVAVRANELSPDLAGNVYCHMMAACHELADVGRAARWVAATDRWIATMPSAVVFAGICRVHRSQVLQITGEWARAEAEATRVCTELTGIHTAAVAEAHYQVGELRRLRGDRAAAAEAYRRAHELGRDPQPGYALLRLAEGHGEAAAAGVHAALLARAGDWLGRAPLRAAQAEIALARGDLPTAREAVDELGATAAAYGTSGLTGAADRAAGALLLAHGQPEQALPVLLGACRTWHGCGARYDVARVRLLLAAAYSALGDADSATLELDAADAAFAELGAVSDRAAVAALRGTARRLDGLTVREVEVLTCLAAGRTNREIAAALVISEKTVERHLSNIFGKLALSSRTAAAGYAYEHGLMGESPQSAAAPDGWSAR